MAQFETDFQCLDEDRIGATEEVNEVAHELLRVVVERVNGRGEIGWVGAEIARSC